MNVWLRDCDSLVTIAGYELFRFIFSELTKMEIPITKLIGVAGSVVCWY